jgi:Stress responsive A/B Barrel Domain
MIRHTVVFALKHPRNSAEEKRFLEDALVLAGIPKVLNFERMRQVSRKNAFNFGFSMEFQDRADYDAYDVHPIHVAFVRDRWKKEVADFMEIDYVSL